MLKSMALASLSLALGCLTLPLSSPRYANTSSSQSIDYFKSVSSMDLASYPARSLVSIATSSTDSGSTIYVYWNDSRSSLVDYFVCSVSMDENTESETGYNESFKECNAEVVATKIVSTSLATYCYKVTLVDPITYRVCFGYAGIHGETRKEINKSFHFTASGIEEEGTKETINVTDKLVSFFNVSSGETTAFSSYFSGKGVEYYQEQYIACNFDIPLEKILWIDIESSFYTKAGIGTLTYLHSNAEWQNIGFSTLKHNVVEGEKDSETFHIIPQDIKYSTIETFGLTQKTTAYHFNTILDLENDDFSSDFDAVFNGGSYSAITNALKDESGNLKYRWFIRYTENKVNFEIVSSDYNNTWEYAPKVNADLPLQRGKDTAIVKLCYQKDGRKFTANVNDTKKDSTEDPITPITPSEKTGAKKLEAWQYAVIVAFFLALTAILGFLIKPIGTLFRYVFLGLWRVLEVVIDLLYLLLFWWWLAIIRNAEKEPLPALWLWSKKGGKSKR